MKMQFVIDKNAMDLIALITGKPIDIVSHQLVLQYINENQDLLKNIDPNSPLGEFFGRLKANDFQILGVKQ